MPSIIMISTLPTIFRIPVTQALSTYVCYSAYPPQETHMTYCYPPTPYPAHCCSEGMKPLDNRHEILRCYEVFKVIVGI